MVLGTFPKYWENYREILLIPLAVVLQCCSSADAGWECYFICVPWNFCTAESNCDLTCAGLPWAGRWRVCMRPAWTENKYVTLGNVGHDFNTQLLTVKKLPCSDFMFSTKHHTHTCSLLVISIGGFCPSYTIQNYKDAMKAVDCGVKEKERDATKISDSVHLPNVPTT